MSDSIPGPATPGTDKIALRSRLVTQRRLSDPAVRLRTAVVVQTVLISVVRAQHPACVATYVPIGTEPGGADLPAVLAAALPPGARLLLPVLRPDNDLDWADFDGSLRAGRRGLLEPGGTPHGPEAIRDADL